MSRVATTGRMAFSATITMPLLPKIPSRHWSGATTGPGRGGPPLPRSGHLRALPWRERDGVAELLQPPHVMPLQPRRVEALEVVGAQVPVGLPISQHVVDGPQQAVGDGDDGLLGPAAARHPPEERLEVGALAARLRPGDLAEHPAQPGVALRRLA